jgi:phosphatidylserine/phosphatidylglycerophosphate/cardiolipin synthase-like enzyme
VSSFVPFVSLPDAQPPPVERDGADITTSLPSPPRQPGDPIVRSAAARHEGAPVVFLPLRPASGEMSITLSSPVTGPCRQVALPTAIAGMTTLLEITPLPFAIRGVVRRLPGLPTFYLGATGGLPPDDEVLTAGEQIATAATGIVGAVFGDRVALSPAAWIDLIGDALDGFASPGDVAAWRALDGLAASGRVLRVLDHVGRPAPSYELRVNATTVTTDAVGEVAVPAGDVSVRWLADEHGVAPGGPVHARYEAGRNIDSTAIDARGSSTPPGGTIVIPTAQVRPHLQLLDSTRWFPARPAGLHEALGHVHPDSRMQPLVDGTDTFAVMLRDLLEATDEGCGAHFAGWAFNDFPLDENDEEHTMFVELVKKLRAGAPDGVDADAEGARFLMDEFFVLRDDAPTEAVRRLAVLLLVAGADVLIVKAVADAAHTDGYGLFIVGLATIAASLLVSFGDASAVFDALESKMEQTPELHTVFNEIRNGIALRARHPASWADNPLGHEPAQLQVLGFDHRDYTTGVGSYHQKFQVVRRSPDPVDGRVIGYLGGVDINQGRLDTWGHHGSGWIPPDRPSRQPSVRAFHDVHVRITGPAAADVAHTFERRWLFDTSRRSANVPERPPAFFAPASDDIDEVPLQPARHIVQVCRSGYAPEPGGGSVPLPWSPTGEDTIPRGFVNAINNAQEFIYIEDQYFTPHDAYVHALLEASTRNDHSLRLVIVIPSNADNLFGDIRRRELFERLRDDGDAGSDRGWGNRLIVGAPMRRPVLADAGRIASRGRLTLQQTLAANPDTGDTVVLGPRSRLPPKVPFWVTIEGERMLAVERNEDLTVDSVPSTRYLVRRAGGAEPLWGGTPREHAARAPVTLAQETGIYVHTKAMIVDDVFVGVGSCNANRRGFFHDGEITAFAVPEQLKAAPDNPARALRCALWAEHLGIPPSMGPALLADPVAAADLFRRPTQAGNRFSRFSALGIKPEISLFDGEAATWMKMLQTIGVLAADGLVPFVWNVLADPTTATDPLPTFGPELGIV